MLRPLAVHPAFLAVQPSFSTVPRIILNQSLIPCYASPVSADQNSRRPTIQNYGKEVRPSNPCIFKRFRTLVHDGAAPTRFVSIASALFAVQRRGCPFSATHGSFLSASSSHKFFRIITYKKCSKQRTLSAFRINTYEETGEGVLSCP